MRGVNKVILIGRLGKEPVSRVTQNGRHTTTINVATSESWTKEGSQQERTEWHWVVLWDKQAEAAAKYLKKGSSVYIEGKIQSRSYEDKQGQKKFVTEIMANVMQFMDSAKSDSEPPATVAIDEDLPF